MADWTPLTDDDPIPGDPVALTALVAGLRNDVRDLWAAVAQLQVINAAGIWSGDAAAAFTRRREKVVPDLDRAAQRLDRAAFALETFGQAVNESQFRARTARERARTAQQSITHAQTQLEEVARQDAAARRPYDTWAAQHPDLPAPLPPASFSPDWNGVAASGEQEMAAARLLFDQACEVYAEAENRCDKILNDAIHDELADPKKRGFLGSIGHAVSNIADHFTDLEKFSDLLGATAAVIGVASMVPGLQFLAPVGIVTSGLKTLVDINLAATGRQGWGEVGKDALGLALFGASRYATAASRASLAKKVAGDLEDARVLARANRLGEVERTVQGRQLTGREAYQHLRKQSDKILEKFGDDQVAGHLPSWRRAIYAIRHPAVDLPDVEALSLSRAALWWGAGALAASMGGALIDSHEVGERMDEEKSERRNEF